MSTLITAARYTQITGDAVGDEAAFDAEEAALVARLEGELRRGLVATERTEQCRVWADGWAYPSATPVLSAVDSDDPTVELTVQANRVQTGISTGGALLAVTYTGGYDTATCPDDLARGVAWAIHTQRNPASSGGPDIPAGVTQMSVAGEFSISMARGLVVGADGQSVPARLAALSDLGGRACALLARYARKATAA